MENSSSLHIMVPKLDLKEYLPVCISGKFHPIIFLLITAVMFGYNFFINALLYYPGADP